MSIRHPAGQAVNVPDTTTEHEDEKYTFGFWVFLMSDAVLFAVLFATYAVATRGIGHGPAPAEAIDLRYVFPETLLLLTSTLTLGLATLALRHDDRASLIGWLAATLVLGAAFIALEAAEFHDMATRGLTPQLSGFLSGFFTLVGTHGLHLLVGLLWGLVMLIQVVTRTFSGAVSLRLLRFSLYWHFLDLIWVGIFSVVYLKGVLG
ncbi:MAG: cytochrome c oxidase subunit 3 [Thiobacillus sp.]|nr:cytochrome c oxidase subunit 3 [Thiobacillus sp.]